MRIRETVGHLRCCRPVGRQRVAGWDGRPQSSSSDEFDDEFDEELELELLDEFELLFELELLDELEELFELRFADEPPRSSLPRSSLLRARLYCWLFADFFRKRVSGSSSAIAGAMVAAVPSVSTEAMMAMNFFMMVLLVISSASAAGEKRRGFKFIPNK
jgi:hypothetical protein